MSNIPNLSNACIAPDVANHNNSIYMIGADPVAESTLLFYSLNLDNIISPSIVLLNKDFNSVAWQRGLPLACMTYPTYHNSSPVTVFQTGFMPNAANFFPNGTISPSVYFPELSVNSPNIFSNVGTHESNTWIVAVTNNTNTNTTSPWAGFRFNAIDLLDSRRDVRIYAYPTADPLVSVGASSNSSNPNIKGYHIVFDKLGAGSIYNVVALNATVETTVLLSDQYNKVNMDDHTFSANAITVSMGEVGYILDMSEDSTIDVYYVNPSLSSDLGKYNIESNVPPFLMNMAATSLNDQLIVYGFNSQLGISVFNRFNPITKTWAGPGLITPTPTSDASPTSSWVYTSGNSYFDNGDIDITLKEFGIISGSTLGVIFLFAIFIFLLVRSRKRHSNPENEPDDYTKRPKSITSTIEAPLMEGDYLASHHQLYLQHQHSRGQSIGSQSQRSSTSVGSEFSRPLSLAGPPLPERNYLDSNRRKSMGQFPGYQLPRGSIAISKEDYIEPMHPEANRIQSTIGMPIMESGHIDTRHRHSMTQFSGESQGSITIEYQVNTTRPT